MKMLSKKDDDDDKYGGGKNKGVGKNNKNQKNSTTNNTNTNNNNNNSNSINNNSNSNNVIANTDQVIHSYVECSAYCHTNKRIGDTDGTEREGAGEGGGGGGEGERTRAYWLCQLPVSSVSLVTDQKITVRENYGPRDSVPSDVAHTTLLPAMSDLTGLAYGKIYTVMKINSSSDMN